MFAPFAVIFGPIAHDAEDPINPWPGVLLTAFLIAVAVQLGIAVTQRGRRRG
jgi:hypothetical protein